MPETPDFDQRADAVRIIRDIVAKAARIETAKQGQALTPDEVRTVRAAGFLRQIAPWALP